MKCQKLAVPEKVNHMNWNRLKSKTAVGMLSCLLVSVSTSKGEAQLLPGERDVVIASIPGVIEAGTPWELVWAGLDNGDGIVASPDGGVLFAQEQFDRIRKIEPDGTVSIFMGPESDEPTHVMNTMSISSTRCPTRKPSSATSASE